MNTKILGTGDEIPISFVKTMVWWFCSLNDRKPISDDDDVIILVVPDYQMLSEVQKIASVLAEDTESRVGISEFYWTETNVSISFN